MIRLEDVEFQDRGSDFRLRLPDMQVSRGETVAIVGPSGSGKTTFIILFAQSRAAAGGPSHD